MMSSPSQIIRSIRSGTSVQLLYPARDDWPWTSSGTPLVTQKIHVSVLDSSFNPPTLAHLSIATSPSPTGNPPYDAHLLLLSVRNADKMVKPGDATFEQRLEMMTLLAKEMEPKLQEVPSGKSVAVAAIDEPTFAGKSTKILEFLESRSPHAKNVSLTFLVGYDTLVRIFSPRFYSSPTAMREVLARFFNDDGSRIVCARRVQDAPLEDEETFLNSEEVKEYVKEGKVKMIDIEEKVRGLSSTEVRKGALDAVPECIADYVKANDLYGSTM